MISKKVITKLKNNKSRVSLFIEPKLSDVKKAKLLNADCIEIHTGRISNLVKSDKSYDFEFNRIKKTSILANKLNIEVHAGHGLTYDTVKAVAVIPELVELNIGHFLVGEAIFKGLDTAISEMRILMDSARQNVEIENLG